MYAKRVSGPYPLSCITCRERRKKCDRARPTCKRCEAGGFTCLGYASRETYPADSQSEQTPQAQKTPSFEPSAIPRCGRSNFSGETPLSTIDRPGAPKIYDIQNALALMPSTPVLYQQPPASSFTNPFLAGNASCLESPVNQVLTNNCGVPRVFTEPTDRRENSSSDLASGSSWNSPSCLVWSRHQTNTPAVQKEMVIQLDLPVYLGPDTSLATVEYITSQYERAYSLMALELTNIQDSFVKTCVIGRITVSKGSCWSLFIGAKVFEAATSCYHTRFTKQYVKTLDTFEKHIAAIDLNGLDRFAIADVTISFLTGLPQFISWNTAFVPELARLGWEEWLPACPVMFLLVLCRINSWRQRDPVSRDLDEWRRCEEDIKEWRPDYRCAQDPSQSWRTIGRLSVQEALRHMVLIYLYMGMRGSKSDDHQVQASCKQIVQLCKLVNANPNMAVHLHFPAMIAGICAINENHRSVIFKCLEQAEACRSYLFATAGFSSAIEHLWHGAGANGAPVTWEDYLDACRTVIRMEEW
ncbi:unnamed protein product [Rhizoctonia solani]|uniref:Zn(2)-C6 fungal-type domain-containing protein n=1 Tax=Rhizoctonia solani TaxID=456999 RepID=A0A8H3C1Q8_9AGAM|nr:unnamed protein product [Rhizoctonia solani]